MVEREIFGLWESCVVFFVGLRLFFVVLDEVLLVFWLFLLNWIVIEVLSNIFFVLILLLKNERLGLLFEDFSNVLVILNFLKMGVSRVLGIFVIFLKSFKLFRLVLNVWEIV